MKNKSLICSNFILMMTAVIWGSSFVVRKTAAEDMPPLYLNFLCFLSGFAVIFLVYLITKKRSQRKAKERNSRPKYMGLKWHMEGGLIVGFFYGVGVAIQQIALLYIDAGKCSFITSLYIIMIPFLSFLILKKKIRRNIWFSAIIAVLGMLLISYNGTFKLEMGDLLTLGCALSFALEITLLGRYLEGANPLLLVSIQMLEGAAICLTISFLMKETVTFDLPIEAVLSIGYIGIITFGVANIMHFAAQKNVPPSLAGLILSFEAVFGLLFGVLLLNESIGIVKGAGCFLMLIAVIWAQKEPKEILQEVKR